MITRPLDLAARLRPGPRHLDGLFFVNAGLLVLFFALFGSHFVLAPGLALNFRLPVVAGANANAKAPTHVISVVDAERVLASDGPRKLRDLKEWLERQARTTKSASPVLLVRGSAEVQTSVLVEISGAAAAAGFEVIWAAGEPAGGAREGGL